MERCKDCRWSRIDEDGKRYCINDNIRCLNIPDIDIGNDHDKLLYEYDEGGKFFTGDYFGCVHHSNK